MPAFALALMLATLQSAAAPSEETTRLPTTDELVSFAVEDMRKCMWEQMRALEPSGEPSINVALAASKLCEKPIVAYTRLTDIARKERGEQTKFHMLSATEITETVGKASEPLVMQIRAERLKANQEPK